jgi:import inner membrane translocase subunit TIM23
VAASTRDVIFPSANRLDPLPLRGFLCSDCCPSIPATYNIMWPFTSSGSPDSSSNNAGPSSSSTDTTMAQDSPTTYFSSDSARFDQSSSPLDPSLTPSSQDVFSNPALDFARLHPLAGLGKDEVEYLDVVDAQPSTLEGGRTALPSRGWSDDLCYGTGTTYLSGEWYSRLKLYF